VSFLSLILSISVLCPKYLLEGINPSFYKIEGSCMEVKLIAHTPDPDRVCSAAAFTSWKKKSMKKLFSDLNDKEANDFLKKVIGFGHLSVTEHASFTFSVKGISRACSHQIVRHRIASYTQQSQRYVKFKPEEIEYVTPPKIEKNPDLKKKYDSMMDDIAVFYKEMLEKDVPPEDARYILPNAAETNLVITMNGRALLNFFGFRLCTRAQWEIRKVAQLMLKEVKKVAPVLFEDADARCEEYKICPEGELTCGRYPPIEKKK
jgi:thymidylate synthase (FAD)